MKSINEKGITLIALVITIIVLLVLAGVSLSLVLGENGIIEKSQKATTATRNAEEKEKIEMAVAAAQTAGNGVLTTENLNTELGKVFGEDKTVEESKVRRLPAEYQEVEYIESTGTQWIDTNLMTNNKDISYETKIKWKNNSTRQLFGANQGVYFGINSSGKYQFGHVGEDATEINAMVDSYVQINVKYNYSNTPTYTEYSVDEQNGTYQRGYGTYIPIRLFSIQQASGNGFFCQCFLQYFKICIEDDLFRYYIPCYSTTTVIDVNGKQCPAETKGLYDLVEGKFYTNQNSSGEDFKVGKNIKTSEKLEWIYELTSNRKYLIDSDGKVEQLITEEQESLLPKEYQQVEYIESTGTQYIDTKIIPNINTRIITHIYRTERSKTWQFPFGARNEAGIDEFEMCFYKDGGGWRDDFGNTLDRIFFNYTDETGDFYIDKNKNMCKINDINITHTDVSNIECDFNCTIFGVNYNLGVRTVETDMLKLFYFKMYNNDSLARDFIPCYSLTTVTDVEGKQCPAGTKGLYDLVEGKFYTNQGNGEDFKAGPDV